MIRDCTDLHVWREAMDLTLDCYRITRSFPKEERYALTSQMRRAATSIPANIAEGQGRYHTKEFLRFLQIAYGSLKELETHIYLAQRLSYIDGDQADALFNRTRNVGRMLNGLMSSLRDRPPRIG